MSLQDTLLLIGIACVLGAIVGGGLKLATVELPSIASIKRQLLLALAGFVIIASSFTLRAGGDGSRQTTPTVPATILPTGIAHPTVTALPTSSTTEAQIELSKTSGPPGTMIDITGRGFAAGETVVIRFHTEQVAEVVSDGQGAFSARNVQIPSDWQFTGQFDLIASGKTSLRFASAPFRVT